MPPQYAQTALRQASCLRLEFPNHEVRFENHKRGYKANGYVTKYGLHLLPEIYECYNPMSYAVAAAKEKSLAEELRAEGYAVWQN